MNNNETLRLAALAEMEKRKRDGTLVPPEPLWKPFPDRNGKIHPQRMALESEADELFFGGAPGGGKLISLETMLPTPSGYTRAGDIKPGDELFDENGKICRVVAFSKIEYQPKSYKLVFDDGFEIVACADHKWLTFTNKERKSLLRQTDEWREKRRTSRPSRVSGNKSSFFTQILSTRNTDNPPPTKEPSSGSVVTTQEIFDSLRVGSDRRVNHAIQIARPLALPEIDLPIDPYVLGAWLGDGTKTGGGFTGVDQEIWEEIEKVGFKVTHAKNSKKAHYIRGLSPLLRLNNLYMNKHIPDVYLRSSVEQRLSLLQGLMDTDGYVDQRGKCEFTNMNYALARGVLELIISLGNKASISTGRATLNGKDCGEKYRILWRSTLCPFRLSRKIARWKPPTRQTSFFRYIVDVVPVAYEPMRCFSVDSPSHLFLVGEAMIPTHNSDLLIGLATTQHYNSIIFRRELQQMKGAEGIIARSHEIIGDKGRFNGQDNIWRKIEGVRTLEFGGVKNEADKKKYQGRAHGLKGFDEITEFAESQYEYLIGWNRTKHPDERARVVCTGNPPTTPEGQWVTRRWAAWLDKKHPRPAKPGELRWYANVNGKDTEVADARPFVLVDDKIVYDFDPKQFRKIDIITPKSRTFIPSYVTDNPIYMASGYIATIQRLPEPLRTIMLDPEKGFNMTIKDDLWQVIPTAWVMNAMARGQISTKPLVPMSAMGVDPSRGGEDEFIIAKRYGSWFEPLIAYAGYEVPDGQTGAALVAKELEEGDDPVINIDVIGVGSSPHDFLVEMGVVSEINDVNFAEGSQSFDETGKFKMGNVRAECYWGMRQALNPEKGDDLCFPDDDLLKADLCAPRYKITTRGIMIESKEEIRERIGRSPDRGDAVVLARYLDVTDAPSMYFGFIQ